jgi:hypothetical protein
MEHDYKSMNTAELEGLLKTVRGKLEDAEDELSLILERSNSGQHMGSKYVQSNGTRLRQEIESLNTIIESAKIEMEHRAPVAKSG